jgi:2-keto-4-pentenoate hydratase/2-oxohepta-3-ene-1,7-dioic acid hydratase in catechol pathway
MKLLRVGPDGREKPAILDDSGTVRDLSNVISDWSGAHLSDKSLQSIQQLDLTTLPALPKDERIGPCVAKIGKFICIGLNYADHAAETGAEVPDEPVIFNKWTSAVCGPNDPIIKPKNSTKLDWEVELGVVIGKTARYVSNAQATDHIAGYCVINDVSERNFQLERGGQWDKGKGCDSFGPIGPWLVTRDAVTDINNLSIWLEVNGKRYQDGNTRTMIFKVNEIVSYLSQFMSLQPGDVISTGTPPGVGLGLNPPVYLEPDDVVRLGIEGLGEQQQTVINPW